VGLHPLTPCRVGVRAVFATAAAVTLVAAAPAAAAIIPGRGMAGVTLRMTEAQVRTQLGAPLRITRTRGALGLLVTRLHYRRVEVDLQPLGIRPVVIRILTTQPRETTASGVGVGWPITAVERLRAVRCWWESSAHFCGIGNRDTPLRRFTLFWIGAHARVTLIEVSLNVNS
jgi:hypothetical protein